MINRKRSAVFARKWVGVYLIVLLTGLVLVFGCSEKSVNPDPQPLTLMQAISYFDWNSGDLKYVEKTEDYWGNPEVVHYQGNVGSHSSLALDAQGVPHIAYYDGGNADLLYATRTPIGWRHVIVDHNGNVGRRCSIALSPMGIPYIAYRDDTDGRVKCAWKVDDAWVTETTTGDQAYGGLVPCGEDYGFTISIAVDSDGNPHISYQTINNQLGYAMRNSQGEWLFEVADSDGNVGIQCSLVLDAQGNPHISYLTYPSYRVKYAWKTSGVWQKEVITVGDIAHGCVHYTDLALDAQGIPHISFYTVNTSLGYLMKANNSGWLFETADDNGNVGAYSSLILDAQGNPHISYFDAGNFCLKYATKTSGGWAIAVVDDKGSVGWYSSLCMCYH